MEVDKKVVPDNTENKATAAEEFGYAVQEVSENKKQEVDNSNTPIDPQSLINDTIKTLDIDEKGKFIYPDDMDPMLKAAIGATKSFRDTQSSFTKGQQDLKGAQAEAEALREQIATDENPLSGLSPAEVTELAELKFTNPDAWHKRLQALEGQTAGRVEEKFKEVREKATQKSVQEQRFDALAEFNENVDPKQKLTTEMLDNDVPPRWIKEVHEGKLEFGEFLTRSQELIYGKKVVKNKVIDNPTDLTEAAGGTKDPAKPEEGIDYANVTF